MKVLKFKYNKNEMFALKALMESTVIIDESNVITDRLLLATLMPVYKRIHTKTFEVKDKYTLSLTAAESIAFAIYYCQGFAGNAYEKRLIRIIVAETDKQLL